MDSIFEVLEKKNFSSRILDLLSHLNMVVKIKIFSTILGLRDLTEQELLEKIIKRILSARREIKTKGYGYKSEKINQ